jgi:aromatic-L-amino-acid decarboxylase
MAYIPGGGLPHAAIADLMALTTNRYVGLWRIAPVVAQIEATVIRWLADMVGYGPQGGGFLTSGGSLANWSALIVAREQRLPDLFRSGVVYTSSQAHHSIQKAVMLAGIPSTNLRLIAVDHDLRIRLDELERQIGEDRRQGLQPLAVIGQGGTTNTGAVDDLQGLADLAHQEGLWMHVDAAYGGFFRLTQRGKAALRGIERADSITLDPHKGLFLPYGTGGLLVRDRALLQETFAGRGDYMTETAEDEFYDFCDISPELSRDFRGLRMWLPIKMHGIGAFRQCLDEKLDLAGYVASHLQAMPGIELIGQPPLSIVAFRLVAPGRSVEELNQLNRRLLDQINASRRVALTPTTLGDKFVIRLCILSFRTHRDRIDECLGLIRKAAGELGFDPLRQPNAV